MIRVKRTAVLSPSVVRRFSPHSVKEWRDVRPYRREIYNTAILWTLYHNARPLCVIVFQPKSLIGTCAEVFFLLCKGVEKSIKSLIHFIRRGLARLQKIYPLIVVRVEDGFWIGHKFVRFFNFVPVKSSETEIYYERRLTWQ